MPKSTKPRVPQYLLHKPSGHAITYVYEAGKRRQVYLGKHGSEESHQKFREILRTYGDEQGLATKPAPAAVTIAVLVDEFLTWAEDHYPDRPGSTTTQAAQYRYALAPVLARYADLPAQDFGPRRLKSVLRDYVTKQKLARKTANNRMKRVRQMFKWATSEEMVPAEVTAALYTVPGLRKGQKLTTTTGKKVAPREPRDVGPVSREDMEACFCVFRIMVTPLLIQIVFWIGVVLCVVLGALMLKGAHSRPEGLADPETRWLAAQGYVVMFIGPLVVRILCESWILFYRMNETLTQILHEQERQNRRGAG